MKSAGTKVARIKFLAFCTLSAVNGMNVKMGILAKFSPGFAEKLDEINRKGADILSAPFPVAAV